MKIGSTCLAASALATFSLIINASEALLRPETPLTSPNTASKHSELSETLKDKGDEQAATSDINLEVQQTTERACEHPTSGELSLSNAEFYTDEELDTFRDNLISGIQVLRILGKDEEAPQTISTQLKKLFGSLIAPALKKLSFVNIRIDDALWNIIATDIKNNDWLRNISTRNCGITDATATSITTLIKHKASSVYCDMFHGKTNWEGKKFSVKFFNESGIAPHTRSKIKEECDVFKLNHRGSYVIDKNPRGSHLIFMNGTAHIVDDDGYPTICRSEVHYVYNVLYNVTFQ